MKSNYQIKSTTILQNLELETILESIEKQWFVTKYEVKDHPKITNVNFLSRNKKICQNDD